MPIPIGDYLPDMAELNTGVAAVATNVFPAPNSYRPAPQATAFSSAMEPGAIPCGVAMAQLSDGSYRIFGGSADKLWLMSGTSWDEVGSGYTATVDERWSFAQFGDAFIAVNINDQPQVLNLGSESLLFEDLLAPEEDAVPPPRARFVDVMSDFVILASLADDPAALQWSGINAPDSWIPGLGLSDIQTFPSGGRVMNISGAAGLVIQERAIRQMIRAPGSGYAFEFQELEAGKGTIAPFSVIKLGPNVGYLNEDGFWFAGQPIGKHKVDRTFFDAVLEDKVFSVVGAVDPSGPRLVWAYKEGDANSYNRMLVYDWSLGRWSMLDSDAFPAIGGLWDVAGLATVGLTMADLDAQFATMSSMNSVISLDSRRWLGGRPLLAGLGANGVLAFFDGLPARATVETGEVEPAPGSRVLTRAVRPLVDSQLATVKVGARDRLGDARSWSAESALQPSGRCPVRASGRYQRFRIEIPAVTSAGDAWTHVQGVDLETAPLGIR